MSSNDKKNDELNIDDMNIKSHLNTSLDLNGINVSEDLIYRTLEAVKNHPAEDQNDKNAEDGIKKTIPWNRYIRRFAGIAAAMLIIVVGYSSMKLMNNENKFDSSTQAPEVSYDTTAKADKANGSTSSTKMKANLAYSSKADTASTGTASNESNAANDNASVKSGLTASTAGDASANQTLNAPVANAAQAADGTTSDIATTTEAPVTFDIGDADDDSSTTADSSAIANTNEDVQQSRLTGKTAKSFAKLNHQTFQNIIPLKSDDTEYITITDTVSGDSITLKSQTDIIDFYTRMENYKFTKGTGTNTDVDYIIEIGSASPEDDIYTINVGQSVTVRKTDDNQVDESFYTPVDNQGLNNELAAIMQ